MRTFLSGIAVVLVGSVVLIATAGVILGRETLWATLFGNADQGPVVFETLTRRAYPNDALIGPRDVLINAQPDREAPVWSLPAQDLYAAVRRIAAGEPHTIEVSQNPGDLTARYVQYTPLLRFPDTIDVRVINLGQGRSTLALYSRSQIGWFDMGTNRQRLNRWLAGLPAR